MPIERRGDTSERVDSVPCTTAFFEPGDHRLRGTHPLDQCPLAEPGLGTQVVDELPDGEVLLDTDKSL